jgi:hypothetical protein
MIQAVKRGGRGVRRTFVRANKQGDVVATLRTDALPEQLEHPFGELAEGDLVLELDPEDPANDVPVVELHHRWKVEPRRKRLVRRRTRAGKEPVGRSRTRR